MIFVVPEDVKGSFVLSSLKKACWAKMQIAITGNDLYAPDVKAAIKNGVLVPFIDGEYDGMNEVPSEVIIVNKSGKTLVLDDIILKPGKSTIISRARAEESARIQGAENDELIEIITESAELGNKTEKKKITKKKTTAKKKTTKAKKETVEYVEPVEDHKEDPQTTAKVWDFQKGESEDAVMVNKVSDAIEIDMDDVPDLDMVDEEDVPETAEEKVAKNKTVKKTSAKKKIAKKKTVRKIAKKKGKSAKSKKVKEIRPVGEVREYPDIAPPLDSRGNIIGEKPSDVLESLIDEHTPDDIPFADKEQEVERKQKRELSEDWDWDDL